MIIIVPKLESIAYFVGGIARVVEVQYLGGFHLHLEILYLKLKRTHCRYFFSFECLNTVKFQSRLIQGKRNELCETLVSTEIKLPAF